MQLFRLDRDPGETENLAAKEPEKVRELLDLLKQQVDSGRSTPGPRVANDRERIELFRSGRRYLRR